MVTRGVWRSAIAAQGERRIGRRTIAARGTFPRIQKNAIPRDVKNELDTV